MRSKADSKTRRLASHRRISLEELESRQLLTATLTIGGLTPVQNGASLLSAIAQANSADGDTILLKPGTYTLTAPLHITKDLTLESQKGQASGVVIQPSSPQSITPANFGTHNNSPIIFVDGSGGGITTSTGVVIQNITLNGLKEGTLNNGFEGIAYYDATGTVYGVTVKGIQDKTLGSVTDGVAIVAYAPDGSSTINISHVTVSTFQAYGIALDGAGLQAKVQYSTVTGLGGRAGVQVQDGITVAEGAAATITHNKLAGFAKPTGNAAFAACAISTTDAGSGLTITNNSVTSSWYGISVLSTATIQNNVLSGTGTSKQGYGIAVGYQGNYAVNGSYVAGNTVTNYQSGIDVEGASSDTLTIYLNTLKHNQNGLDLVTGGTATNPIMVTDNVIQYNVIGVHISDDGSVSDLTYAPTDTVPVGNRIGSNQWGIVLDSMSGVTGAPGTQDATLTANHNNISWNSQAGVYEEQSSAVDMTGNWWNSANGPNAGANTGKGDKILAAPGVDIAMIDYGKSSTPGIPPNWSHTVFPVPNP